MGSRTTRDIALMTRENRSRRAAQRQGLVLTKIRRRDRLAPGWNRWHLRGPDGALLAGDEAAAIAEAVERCLGVSQAGASAVQLTAA